MPLDREFKKHLHDVMVEVAEKLAEPEAQYGRELVWKAQNTMNSAALPIAYKNAQLHAIETRFEQTVERYLQALVHWGGIIDDGVVNEMQLEINQLTSGPNVIHFPPAVRAMNIEAVQQSFAMERARLTHRLQLSAANRMRELKMKSKQPQQAAPNITNYNAPVTNHNAAVTNYLHSTHIQINELSLSATTLKQIQTLSEGHADLQDAAREIQTAQSQGTSVVEKAQKWATLLNSAAGIADKLHQHYPDIVAGLKALGIHL